MAIESLYWREELLRIAKTIRPIAKPRRWSERAVCTVERDVMIGFFIVRRMIELHKVSSLVAEMELDVFGVPATKTVTKLNRFSIERNYDWSAEKPAKKKVLYVCNQFIHAYVSWIERSVDRNWSDFFVISDFDRNKSIWRIRFDTISDLFTTVSNDWPYDTHLEFDPGILDYKVTAV